MDSKSVEHKESNKIDGNTAKILIVDDEPFILEALYTKMRRENYSAFTAKSAEDGMRLFRKLNPNLIILDIMLPGRSGLDFCRTIRQEKATPIIFLSAKADENSRIEGLKLGGDDYLTKPFNINELALRVKAILRRSPREPSSEILESGNIRLDEQSHTLKLDDKAVVVTPKLFELLRFLLRNRGHVFSRDQLLDRVWGDYRFTSARTVDVHMRWLRQIIELEPQKPTRIITIRGVGYKFLG